MVLVAVFVTKIPAGIMTKTPTSTQRVNILPKDITMGDGLAKTVQDLFGTWHQSDPALP